MYLGAFWELVITAEAEHIFRDSTAIQHCKWTVVNWKEDAIQPCRLLGPVQTQSQGLVAFPPIFQDQAKPMFKG